MSDVLVPCMLFFGFGIGVGLVIGRFLGMKERHAYLGRELEAEEEQWLDPAQEEEWESEVHSNGYRAGYESGYQEGVQDGEKEYC
jgi:hypothetical protein